MKIIALMPVKNEEWILDVTIPQLKKFADEILCLDGGSTDSTIAKLTSYGALVRQQPPNIVNYSTWRQELLEWARERGGTHLVWLDADEAFTTNFLENFKERLAAMKPGEKISMQWLCLWKSPYEYRDDSSVWSRHYKDFVVCDAPTINFENTVLHEGRTPGPNEINGVSVAKKVPLEQGAVLHYQFVLFKRFQIKQAFQRCREYMMKTGSAQRINNKYSATLDDPKAQTTKIPTNWIDGIGGLSALAGTSQNNAKVWYYDAILGFFKEKGIGFFEPLQIWHIEEFKEMFVRDCGRIPRPKTYPKLLIIMNKIKRLLLRK